MLQATTDAMYPTQTNSLRSNPIHEQGRRVGDVEMATASIGAELDQLATALEDLHKRLDTVLRPQQPTACGNAESQVAQQTSALARAIRENCWRVSGATAMVRELTERIDL